MSKSTTIPTEAAAACRRTRPDRRDGLSDRPARGIDNKLRNDTRRGPAAGDARATGDDCRGAIASIGAYLAGMLHGPLGDAFRRHVRGCEPCHQKLLAVQLFLLLTPATDARLVGHGGAAFAAAEGGRR